MVENHNNKLEQIAMSDNENRQKESRLKIQHFVIVWIFQGKLQIQNQKTPIIELNL